MGKIKKYGYILTWYVGDHLPIHIHVYKNSELSGIANNKIKKAIVELNN